MGSQKPWGATGEGLDSTVCMLEIQAFTFSTLKDGCRERAISQDGDGQALSRLSSRSQFTPVNDDFPWLCDS